MFENTLSQKPAVHKTENFKYNKIEISIFN